MTSDGRRLPAPTAPSSVLPTTSDAMLAPRVASRVATLERDSQHLVRRASRAGADITYLGIAPLFAEPTAYEGTLTDWVISPVTDLSDAVVPLAERERLVRLVKADINFPLLYMAHEIPKGRLDFGSTGPAGSKSVSVVRQQPMVLDQATAAEIVGPVPAPARSTSIAERVGGNSQRLLDVVRTAAPIAAGVVLVPFAVAAAAVTAPLVLAAGLLAGLDPILFGVIPASPEGARAGEPGAWYILAQWNWE